MDDHNNNRHQPISLEVIWATQRWSNRVFAFLLAITEVNIKHAYEYFCRNKRLSMINFRKELARTLINNSILRNDDQNRSIYTLRERSIDHKLVAIGEYKRWNGAKWVNGSTRWPQRKCISCQRRVRTYCTCNVSRGLCNNCYVNHILELETGAIDPH